MAIRRLSEGTVNRIAAGEVVERPAAAVKELVENALDAGASRIVIAASNGGADLILVEDDGGGMTRDDLLLAVERHATSKLPQKNGEDDLSHIVTLGFRGEALPSIGAVARLSIVSRMAGGEAHEIKVEGGKLTSPGPTGFGPSCGNCSMPPRRGSNSSNQRVPRTSPSPTSSSGRPWHGRMWRFH
jgi:DNA mismatch repair protein MutL